MGILRDFRGPVVGISVSTVLLIVVTLVGLVDLLGALTSPGVTLVGRTDAVASATIKSICVHRL